MLHSGLKCCQVHCKGSCIESNGMWRVMDYETVGVSQVIWVVRCWS